MAQDKNYVLLTVYPTGTITYSSATTYNLANAWRTEAWQDVRTADSCVVEKSKLISELQGRGKTISEALAIYHKIFSGG